MNMPKPAEQHRTQTNPPEAASSCVPQQLHPRAEHHWTPINPSKGVDSLAPQQPRPVQHHTTQQSVPAITHPNNSAVHRSGSELQNNAAFVSVEVTEMPRKNLSKATSNSVEPENAADDANSHPEPSRTRLDPFGRSEKELQEDLNLEIQRWGDTNPAKSFEQWLEEAKSGSNKYLDRIFRSMEALVEDEENSADETPALRVDQDGGSTVQELKSGDATSGFDEIEMKGLTRDEAQSIVTEYKELKVEHDDVASVHARPKKWISALMKAFARPYGNKPTFIEFGEMSPEFDTWQKEHAKKTSHKLSSNANLREALATVIFYQVVDRHEAGKLVVCHGTRMVLDTDLSCSMRLKLITAAIENLAIVRWDIATNQRLDLLINSPANVVKIKEANLKVNGKKKPQYKHLGNPADRPGPSKGVRSGTSSGVSVGQVPIGDRERLLEGCTLLAELHEETDDEEGVSRLETAGVEVNGAQVGEEEGDDSCSSEEGHDEMESDDMDVSE